MNMKFERVVESYTYNRFGEILYVLHKNNRKYLNDSLSQYDLNLLQAMCILTIDQKNDINQKELTEILYLTKSGIAKAIKNTWLKILNISSDTSSFLFILEVPP